MTDKTLMSTELRDGKLYNLGGIIYYVNCVQGSNQRKTHNSTRIVVEG